MLKTHKRGTWSLFESGILLCIDIIFHIGRIDTNVQTLYHLESKYFLILLIGHIFIPSKRLYKLIHVSRIFQINNLNAMMKMASCDPHSMIDKIFLSSKYVFINSDSYNILHSTADPEGKLMCHIDVCKYYFCVTLYIAQHAIESRERYELVNFVYI